MKKKALVIAVLALAVLIIVGVAGWQKYILKRPVAEKKVFKVGLLQMAPVVSVNMDGFKSGMEELGYKEGDNIEYTYRDAQGNLDALKQYSKELVDMKPDMIFVNTSPATLAIKEATAGTNIPVVFSMVADPVSAGIVPEISKKVETNPLPTSSGMNMGGMSMNGMNMGTNNQADAPNTNVSNPDINLTGTSCAYIEIAPKRIEILAQAAPKIKKVLVFYRPEDKSGGGCTDEIIAKGKELGLEIIPQKIAKKEDIEAYLKNLKPGDVDAVMDPGDSMVSSAVDTIIKYAEELKIPYMALSKGEVDKGATMGFAVDYFDIGKQTSLMANQVLAGISPADIPFEKPRKWFFALNLKNAKDIGLEIPPNVIEKANYVIK